MNKMEGSPFEGIDSSNKTERCVRQAGKMYLKLRGACVFSLTWASYD